MDLFASRNRRHVHASKLLAVFLFWSVPSILAIAFYHLSRFASADPEPRLPWMNVAGTTLLLLGAGLSTVGFAGTMAGTAPIWRRSAVSLYVLALLLGLTCPVAALILVSLVDRWIPGQADISPLYPLMPIAITAIASALAIAVGRTVGFLQPIPSSSACSRCGYECHASSVVCPECGDRRGAEAAT